MVKRLLIFLVILFLPKLATADCYECNFNGEQLLPNDRVIYKVRVCNQTNCALAMDDDGAWGMVGAQSLQKAKV